MHVPVGLHVRGVRTTFRQLNVTVNANEQAAGHGAGRGQAAGGTSGERRRQVRWRDKRDVSIVMAGRRDVVASQISEILCYLVLVFGVLAPEITSMSLSVRLSMVDRGDRDIDGDGSLPAPREMPFRQSKTHVCYRPNGESVQRQRRPNSSMGNISMQRAAGCGRAAGGVTSATLAGGERQTAGGGRDQRAVPMAGIARRGPVPEYCGASGGISWQPATSCARHAACVSGGRDEHKLRHASRQRAASMRPVRAASWGQWETEWRKWREAGDGQPAASGVGRAACNERTEYKWNTAQCALCRQTAGGVAGPSAGLVQRAGKVRCEKFMQGRAGCERLVRAGDAADDGRGRRAGAPGRRGGCRRRDAVDGRQAAGSRLHTDVAEETGGGYQAVDGGHWEKEGEGGGNPRISEKNERREGYGADMDSGTRGGGQKMWSEGAGSGRRAAGCAGCRAAGSQRETEWRKRREAGDGQPAASGVGRAARNMKPGRGRGMGDPGGRRKRKESGGQRVDSECARCGWRAAGPGGAACVRRVECSVRRVMLLGQRALAACATCAMSAWQEAACGRHREAAGDAGSERQATSGGRGGKLVRQGAGGREWVAGGVDDAPGGQSVFRDASRERLLAWDRHCILRDARTLREAGNGERRLAASGRRKWAAEGSERRAANGGKGATGAAGGAAAGSVWCVRTAGVAQRGCVRWVPARVAGSGYGKRAGSERREAGSVVGWATGNSGRRAANEEYRGRAAGVADV
ncbi:hypothetical protein GGX14DRAFT_660826 [Mycena pura]|uniref:Uncharacterized protein n=1 Tax=Mycena pura TaxID=153505 RepID=A0AAD6V1F5_9AGAR|nr:hypothetical protein GGX14DRAFT_660826 [Mycena pura]